ncbi:hypothetical protein [Streptomyces sp. NPDC058694]|uniref:hypothetical protein n=1 Tax=Streptomyces sp. NPDC058694 TaxID=3346603 RepID=UPI0036614521
MHTYDSPRRLPYTSPIPAMRPVQDTAGTHSATPIYDALFAEFRKAFRTLPGDRSGEEELGFTAFGTGPHGGGLYGSGLHGTGLLSTSSYNSGAYTPTAYGMRHVGQHQTGQVAAHQSQTVTSVWQPVARQHATGLIPAALPPGPRRER